MSDRQLFAIVLAAGRSSRFGSVKQLARFQGMPLVARALREVEAVCGERTVLVTGNQGADVYSACAPLKGFRVHNVEFAAGLASSIACGVAAVSHVADAVMLTLADQPLVDRRHLAALAVSLVAEPTQIVATGYAGKSGVPAIFPCSTFEELRGLQGDQGARAVLLDAGDKLRVINCEAAAADIDVPADLSKLPDRKL
jgi:molybdenum cofactor cytidylyltransferase